jgi:hypothetical protein
MTTLIGDVALTNKTGVFLGQVNISNLNTDANAVLYSVTGSDIKGDSAVLKFEEDIKKLTVSEAMSYTSAYPIGVETANNENTFFTGVLAQQKNATDGASAHLLITNDLGNDSSFYGGLDMFSSNSTPQYGQFGSIKNALGLSSQSSSIVVTPNAGGAEDQTENGNIMLCYAGGTKAVILNNNGQLIVGADTPSFTGNTYGGDDGGVNNVLTSNGASGLKWTTQGGVYSSYTNQFFSGKATVKSDTIITLATGSGILNKLPDYPTIVDCVFNFSISSNNTVATITYNNNNASTTYSYTQSLTNNGHHIFPVKFLIPADSYNDYNYSIQISVSSGTVSTDANDFYCLEFRQIKGALPP